MYDEKSKERIMRCLKKNYEQFNVRMPKGLKAKYKAFAAYQGTSVTMLLMKYFDDAIEKAGFVYEESADE